MALLIRHRNGVLNVVAVAAPVALGAALVPFRGTLASAAAALIFVVVIVAVAVAGSRVSGALASISSALWFDFFLVQPYNRFTISHRPDLETTVCLLFVGIAVTELAARSRHHLLASRTEYGHVAMLCTATDLAATLPSSLVIEQTQGQLIRLLDLRRCRFDPEIADPPLARILPDGQVVHVGLHWPVRAIGIPGPEAEVLAVWHGRVHGRFVLTPTPGQPVSRERRMIAASLVELVGASLSHQRLDS